MGRRRSCLFQALAAVGVLAVCATLAAASWLIETREGLSLLETVYLQVWLSSHQAVLDTPIGTDDSPIVFVVNPGDTATAIGENLLAQGLITDAALFRNYVRYQGLDDDLEAGTYFLNLAQTLPEIAQALTDSSAASVTVRLLEGWRREEIAAAVDGNPLLHFSGADFLAVTGPGAAAPTDFAVYVGLPAGASLEGFLYPDTYAVPPDATATEFRDFLLTTFRERVGAELQSAAAQAGRTLYEAVTLASIVEREAVFAEEQALIASVYLNRLDAGMTLDADPTVQYGIGNRGGSWWPDITVEDYRAVQSPYNTYLHAGLPPGPIASPSLSAIRAAIFPAESTYFYFRADCAQSGHHVFAITFEEHVANRNCP